MEVPDREGSLGSLINKLESNGLLSENGVDILRGLKVQRNYLMHSIYDLFAARVDETILPRTDLLLSDVQYFTEKVWELEQNLIGLNTMAEREIARLYELGPGAVEDASLLFRP